jgi:hypothetical protein
LRVADTEGEPMLTVGAVLSTLTVELGPDPAAELPAASVAVPAPIETLNVPSPLMLSTVTVRVVALTV